MMRKSVACLLTALSLTHARVSATVLFAGDAGIPDSADFVIVGGGTAGCVLATRLCRDLPQASIALLERGAPRNPAEEFHVTAPRLSESIYGNAGPPEVDVFNYFRSEPNPNLADPASGEWGRHLDLIDGASIGGASNVALQWTYPLSGTVDEWEINGLDTITANSLFERAAGVIGVAQPPPELRHDYINDILNAFAKANYTIKNAQKPGEGGYTAEVNFVTVDEAGHRRSSYTQYLLPALLSVCAERLTVIQDVTATKLLPSSEDKRKIDTVQYVSSSSLDLANPKTIKANAEVILSAGPYGSPKLLLLSGIGPMNDLRSKRISPILADLPVGQRTQLQPGVGAVGRYSGRPLSLYSNTSLLTEKAVQQFLAGQGGPFGLVPSATIGKRDTLGYHTSGFSAEKARPDEPCFSIFCFLNPVGYGNLTIADGLNPFADPIVHTNLLDDPQDFAAALECTEEFRAIIETGFPVDFGMSAYGPFSSTPTLNWVAITARTNWHFVGGSAVGSVVDGDFRVMGGLTGLRVIDVSVIPKLTVSAGPLSSVYMLAEFASDKLVDEYCPVYQTNPDSVSGKCKSKTLTLNVEKALAAAYGNNSSQPSPVDLSTDEATIRAAHECGDALSHDKFTLVLGGTLVIASLVFTAFAGYTMFGKWKENRQGQEEISRFATLQKRSSWVRGKSTTIRGKSTLLDAKDTEHGGDKRALMSWKNLSCKYSSKKLGSDVVTLSGVTGEIRYKELVAIMVSEIHL